MVNESEGSLFMMNGNNGVCNIDLLFLVKFEARLVMMIAHYFWSTSYHGSWGDIQRDDIHSVDLRYGYDSALNR